MDGTVGDVGRPAPRTCRASPLAGRNTAFAHSGVRTYWPRYASRTWLDETVDGGVPKPEGATSTSYNFAGGAGDLLVDINNFAYAGARELLAAGSLRIQRCSRPSWALPSSLPSSSYQPSSRLEEKRLDPKHGGGPKRPRSAPTALHAETRSPFATVTLLAACGHMHVDSLSDTDRGF
jgi:hypothetical protein